MALTIIQQPQRFSPAYNDLIFVVSGTNNTQDNYKYVADIYLYSSTSYDFRLKESPRLDGYGVFDVHQIIQNYLSSDISIQSSEGFIKNTNSYKAFSIKFGEEFGDPPSLTADIETSGTVYAHNAIVDFLDFQNYNSNDRVINGLTQKKYLTDILISPSSTVSGSINYMNPIRSSEKFWLYFITDTVNSASFLSIATFDVNGNNLGSYRVDNPYKALSDNDSRFIRTPIGPGNLSDIPDVDVTTIIGSLPIISDSVKYYSVKIVSDSMVSNDLIFFKIEDVCTKYDIYRIHFLNKWGGFDSFSFIRLSRKTATITRNKFKKTIGDISNGSWWYNKYDRGNVQKSTIIKDKVIVNSDWISEVQSEWLEQLITSPEAYLELNDELIAINIVNSSYEMKLKVNEKLFNLILEFEYSFTRYRQSY